MKDLFFKIAAILILAMASVCHAQTDIELVAFPIGEITTNFVDMGNGHFNANAGGNIGYSLSVARLNTSTLGVVNSFGIYEEGQLTSNSVTGDNWLLWSDFGVVGCLDGFAAKLGLQTSGQPQGVGVFFGFTRQLSIPDMFNNLRIKL